MRRIERVAIAGLAFLALAGVLLVLRPAKEDILPGFPASRAALVPSAPWSVVPRWVLGPTSSGQDSIGAPAPARTAQSRAAREPDSTDPGATTDRRETRIEYLRQRIASDPEEASVLRCRPVPPRPRRARGPRRRCPPLSPRVVQPAGRGRGPGRPARRPDPADRSTPGRSPPGTCAVERGIPDPVALRRAPRPRDRPRRRGGPRGTGPVGRLERGPDRSHPGTGRPGAGRVPRPIGERGAGEGDRSRGRRDLARGDAPGPDPRRAGARRRVRRRSPVARSPGWRLPRAAVLTTMRTLSHAIRAIDEDGRR